MATIIRDSCKTYGAVADAAQNMWAVVSGGAASMTLTPSGCRYPSDNQCFLLQPPGGGTFLLANSPSNDGTCFTFFALCENSAIGTSTINFAFQVSDTGTPQCTVVFDNSTGNIIVHSGSATGTVVATFKNAFSGSGQWNGWNIEIIISTTVGAVNIRKNGASTNTYAVTNINTQGGTGNSYANQYALIATSGGVEPAYRLQDVWMYNSSGAAPNTFLTNDVRTYLQAPNAASLTAFTPSSIPNFGPSSTISTVTLTSNIEYAQTIGTPTYNGTLATCTLVFNAGPTGHAIVGLYDNTGAGGSPGALLATSNAVTNPSSGAVAFTFASPPAVVNTQPYYIAVLADVNCVLKSANALQTSYSLARTYASGFTNPGAMSGVSQVVFAAILTYTSNNYTCVSELAEDGGTTTVSDSNAGDEDRYGVVPLPVTPATIYGTQLRGFMQKSDSGARSGAMTITSGGTNVVGTTVSLTTSFENVTYNQDTDPNTSAAWTAAGLNAALVGVKVVS